jgi:signal transduction histidine kinase
MRAEIGVALDGEELEADTARSVLVSSRDEVERMMHMVENLLTLASIQDGRLQLLLELVELRSVVSSAAEDLLPLASSRGMDITVEGDRARVEGDRERLRHVASNLLENAVKFSPPDSGIRIRVWSRRGEAGFTVHDSGPGIPEELRDHVFDRFFRLDASRSTDRNGSGLGLAISREIVVEHGGRIWVESTPGVGSAFSVALPSV